MPPSIPPGKVSQYVKVRRLARDGVAGERDAAEQIMAKMDVEYPGIGSAADLVERSNVGNSPSPTAQWQEWAQTFMAGMTDFVEKVNNLQKARELVAEVRFSKTERREGAVAFKVLITQGQLRAVRGMSDAQRTEFVDLVADNLAALIEAEIDEE